MINHPVDGEYQAASSSTVYYVHENAGYLRITGLDQAAFIQRQTTNDIRLLRPDRAILSVLTSATARILDVFYIYNEDSPAKDNSEQALTTELLTLPGKAEATYRFLKSRIFFSDKVAITDHSQNFLQIDLFGPQANQLLNNIGIAQPPLPSQIINYTSSEISFKIIGHEPGFCTGYRLIMPKAKEDQLFAWLQRFGAAKINGETYKILRIEAGLPGVGHELVESYSPLECGLRTAVSETKGCYTGQEVIARQITYDKVNQTLCGIRLSQTCTEGERLYIGNNPAGILTSAAQSPRFGFIGLAILKRHFIQVGSQIRADDQIAVISEIPFQ